MAPLMLCIGLGDRKGAPRLHRQCEIGGEAGHNVGVRREAVRHWHQRQNQISPGQGAMTAVQLLQPPHLQWHSDC